MSAAMLDDTAIAPGERAEITKMADAFKTAMKKPVAVPKAVAPVAAPQPSPPVPKPGEKPQPVPEAPIRQEPPLKPSPPVPAPAEQPPKPTVPATEEEPPKNAKDWKAFKEVKEKAIAERDSIKAEAAALKAELETLRKGSAEYERVKAEHATIKQQLQDKDKAIAERDNFLKEFALSHDPTFKNAFDGKIKLHASTVGQFAPPDVMSKFEAILAMGPSKHRNEQVNALVEELADNRMAANAIVNAYMNISHVEQERAVELARASENWAALQARNQQQQQAELQSAMEQTKAFVESAYQQTEVELNGVEADAITAFKEDTRKVIVDRDKTALLRVIKDAAKGQKYDKAVLARDEEITKLKAQVAELTSATPPINGTGGAPIIRPSFTEPSNNDIGGVYQRELQKRRAAGQR